MLDLKPLTENDILEFGRQILHKMETIPSRLLQIIKSHSEGNPFFVEEIIKNFIEDGVIEISENDRIWKANEDLLDLSAVPNTIEGVVQARLDRLPPDEKMIIQKGSAIGRVFWIGALKAMDESAAEKALDKLQDKELVFQKSTSSFEGDREYIFKHQLTQMVAYENTLKNLRRLYHEIIGKWLIEVSGERIDEYYSMIANHFEKAKNWETAFAYYAKAGDQAKDIYTNKGAIDHYKLGLSLLQKLVHTPKNAIIAITMHEGLADVYQLVGDYDEAIRQYQNALDTLIRYNSDQPGSGRKVDRKEGSLSLAEARAEFTRKTGWVYHKKGDFDRAIELFKQAQNYLSDQHKKISARIYADQGYTAQSKGEYEKAIVWCLKGLEIVDGTDNYRELGRINSTLGRVYWLRGDFKSAMTYYSSSLEIFKKIGDIHGISQCYNNMGIISDLTGNFKRAIDYYKQSLEMREQIGDVDGIAMNYNNLGLIYFNQGNFTNAIKYYNKSLELFIRLGNNYRIATLYNNLGEVYCEQGNHPQAISFLERAIDICLSINARQFLPDPYRILAEVFLSLGQLDRTNNFCQTSLEIALKIGSREYEAIVYRVMGELFFHQEEWETSSEYFEKSIRMLLDLGLKIELGKTYYSYAVALKELRHLPSPKKVQKDLKTKSRLYLQEALEIFKQIDNLKMLSKIKNAL